MAQNFTPEEIEQLKILKDPVLWCEAYLRNPEDPSKPLTLRWYQKDILRASEKYRLLRCGRGIGKSISFIADMLYTGFVNPNFDLILICPTEHQVREMFDYIEKIAMSSDILASSITAFTRQPFSVTFGNGSKIKAYTAGVKSGSKALSARGVSGDRIYIDECDYLDDDSLDTLMPLFHRRPTTKVLVSSTPSGKRGHYYIWATNKSLGWREFHYPSSVSPTWVSIEEAERKGLHLHMATEYQNRTSMTEDAYIREYDAAFGEELNGVFKHLHIDQCVHRYRYDDLSYDPKSRYSLGVDWNGEENGVQLVVLEYFPISNEKILKLKKVDEFGCETPYEINAAGKFRVSRRITISAKDSTQRKAIEAIIALNNQYRFDWIGVDAGFGTHQIEDLKAWGMEHPGSGLEKKLMPIEFGGTTEIYDPMTKQKVWKYTKPYMVGVTQNILEVHDLIISGPEEDHKRFLIDQLRNYRIKKEAGNPDRPVYMKGNDHMLDALMVALFVFHLNNSEYTHIQHSDAAYMMDTNVFSHQEEVNARWSDDQIQIANRPVAGPVLMSKVPADMGYSYTMDPKSQHDDPDTKFIYKRSIDGRGTGPWASPTTVENRRPSSAGKEPSSRSIYSNSLPRAKSWSPFGR